MYAYILNSQKGNPVTLWGKKYPCFNRCEPLFMSKTYFFTQLQTQTAQLWNGSLLFETPQLLLHRNNK